MRLLGALIAGGASQRFGSDKALALLNGKALIDHVAEALLGQVDALVMCGRAHGGYAHIADRPAPDMGPLGGLCAALHHAQAEGFEAVLSAGCDVLPVPNMQGLQGQGAAVVAGHYLFGFWPVALADVLDAHLATTPDRSMRSWLTRCNARQIACDVTLHNLNTQGDFLAYKSREGLAA
jgi:molybdenum cofactor guanylyltransferase